MQNPLIVPVKVLRGHSVVNSLGKVTLASSSMITTRITFTFLTAFIHPYIFGSLGVLDCEFHPTQPWVFTAGADSTLRLYT